MTPNQRRLIEKTLGSIGYLALFILISLISLAVFLVTVEGMEIEAILAEDDAAIIFFPALVVSVVSFWIRSFMRAGDIEG